MKRPRCQADNTVDARFCEDCGGRLTLTCSQCGSEVSPGKRFCRSCGAALPEGSAPAGPVPASYTPKHLAEKILTSKSHDAPRGAHGADRNAGLHRVRRSRLT
jgi:hypothetical protein